MKRDKMSLISPNVIGKSWTLIFLPKIMRNLCARDLFFVHTQDLIVTEPEIFAPITQTRIGFRLHRVSDIDCRAVVQNRYRCLYVVTLLRPETFSSTAVPPPVYRISKYLYILYIAFTFVVIKRFCFDYYFSLRTVIVYKRVYIIITGWARIAVHSVALVMLCV